MEGRLSSSLRSRIEKLDIAQPFVWRLKLSESDFNELETCITSCADEKGKAQLVKSENALYTIVYLAEWYKRKYQSGNKNPIVEGLDLETLWRNSGISIKNYLYRDESGKRRWEYSIYVLGGLAIQHELNRNDQMRFLKALCRLYHGEEYTLENLDEAARAVAFRESIKRKHSLYEYMKEILNGDMPFHEDDLKDASSDVNRFVATIKAANDEVLKVKFRFEWVITFSPDYTCMIRKLNVWLKPEEVGGGLHQYLRYDRVHLWGIQHPERLRNLYIYIRYKKGYEIVEPSTMEKPIFTYLPHSDMGFVAVGVDKGTQVKNIPTCKFDKIEIIVKDDNGKEYIAQEQKTTEYIQLWRDVLYGTTWTSTQNAQRETALLFSNRCKLVDESITDEIYRKSFRDQKYGLSESWNLTYIYDSVTFIDDKGKEITLYNRIGYDQITTKLYADTIHYNNGGKIKHYYIDDPDFSDETTFDELPLIFGWEDVVVRHFATKDDILNAQPEEETVAELIEYKQSNGRFTEWTTSDEPAYGEVQLRVTIKGKTFPFTAVYLPSLDKESPIRREYDTTCIRYRSVDKEEQFVKDQIPMDKKDLFPTLPLKYGTDEDYCEVDVYRPTLIKEVKLDGNIIEYLNDGESLELPYIFKDRVQLNDFSRQGYQAYQCKNLCSIYTDDFINIAGNPSTGMAALAVWEPDMKYQGKLLDALAPESLVVCFGRAKNNSDWNGQEALVWNYDKNEEPTATDPANEPDFGIVFQNLSKNKDLTCNYPIQVDDDPWGFDDVEVDIVKCFEVANDAQTYFFLMKPLVEIPKSDIMQELYEPLLERRGGELTQKDKLGLLRYAEEFGFDWQEFKVYIDIE